MEVVAIFQIIALKEQWIKTENQIKCYFHSQEMSQIPSVTPGWANRTSRRRRRRKRKSPSSRNKRQRRPMTSFLPWGPLSLLDPRLRVTKSRIWCRRHSLTSWNIDSKEGKKKKQHWRNEPSHVPKITFESLYETFWLQSFFLIIL